MKKLTTITVPTEDIEPLLLARLEAWKAEYWASLPNADPQYDVAQVAGILSLTQGTIREYLKLTVSEPMHPRHLPYVDATGHPRGYRVLLSDLTAWQQRNRFPKDFTPELPVRRPPRRRP